MMIKSTLIGLVLGLFSLVAVAGGNHSHSHFSDPVSAERAAVIATDRVHRLADMGKIDPSWKSVEAGAPEQKRFGRKLEWVVAFKNAGISDASKQTLYLFLALDGSFLAANYTGK